MGATVYTTAGGRRFHITPDCRALESAQALNDWDDIQPWLAPVLHRPEPRQPLAAPLTGYTACRVCVPPALALPATGQTYGHEPVIETGYYGPEQMCARCNMARLPMLSQPWPCTSAVVLGLVPRKAACHCDKPGADPYACPADLEDCTGHFSELNPRGGA